MSRTPRAGSYRAVLALPHAAPTFGAALVGRLAYGLLPLSVLFTVQQATGSFAVAGAVVATFGLTSVVLPIKSRLVDRFGQRRALPPLAGLCAGALGTLAIVDHVTPTSAVALGSLAGLAAPPLGPAMRSTWRDLTEGTDLRQTAYSLDSVCEESLYLVGPLVVGAVLSVGSGAAALLATSALMLAGTVGMVLPPRERPAHDGISAPPPRFDLGPLRSPGFTPVVTVILATATGISLAFTAIAARAQDVGQPAASGWIEAAIAAGSVVGGLLWGRRRHTRGRSAHLGALVGVLAVGVALGGVAPNLVALGVVMAVAGVAIAPLFVVSYVASDALAPKHQRTEASTWVNTANNIGSAAGAAGAGLLVERVSAGSAFAAGGLLLALTSALVWLNRSRVDRHA
ncbi:MAG: MFS transporter [Marmoricola sp.]